MSPIPEGAEVIDATGKHVYPGLINAHTVLGLVEIGAVRATVDVAESGAINPNVRSITSVNPDSELIPVARSNGILTALSVPGRRTDFRPIRRAAAGWLDAGRDDGAVADRHAFALAELDHRSGDPRARKSVKDQQKEIDKAQKQIRDAFQIARSYWQARKNPSPDFKSDLRWEAMMPIFEGKLPLFVHAGTLAQMEAALAWAKEAQLKIVLVGGNDAWRIAPQLKESDTPVIFGPSTTLPPRRDDGYDSSWSNAARLHEAGVRFCIASDGRGAETNERNVGYEAGMAAGFRFAERRSAESGDPLSRPNSWRRRSAGNIGNRKSRDPDRDQRRSA